MTTDSLQGNVRLYACGGGGINVGRRFEQRRGKRVVGFSAIDATYIDTSRSNLRTDLSADATYIFTGMDGSGKVRKENFQAIAEGVRDILQSFPPQDLNIVLSTAAGGSGSVIGPSLVSELLELDQPTLAVLIGSAETKLEIENTLKTLKSYESIAKLRKSPVVIAYVENGPGFQRTAVDKKIEAIITSVLVLYSRQNREMDSKDLYNWLRFDRVTSFGPMIASLTLVDKDSPTDDLGNTISVATLAASEEGNQYREMPEYQCVGYVPEGIDELVTKTVPFHFVTSDGVLPAAAKRLEDTLTQLAASQKARMRASDVLSKSDNATDNGLVL